jgi:hypothetical protein
VITSLITGAKLTFYCPTQEFLKGIFQGLIDGDQSLQMPMGKMKPSDPSLKSRQICGTLDKRLGKFEKNEMRITDESGEGICVSTELEFQTTRTKIQCEVSVDFPPRFTLDATARIVRWSSACE